MNWQKYKGQELKEGDLVWCRKDGLAFVNFYSLCSIPEAWSYDFQGIYKKGNREYWCFKRKSGWMYNCSGKKIDKIDYILRVKKPKDKKEEDTYMPK